MAATKTSILMKAVTPNVLKRVVSTSATSRNVSAAISIDTCPFNVTAESPIKMHNSRTDVRTDVKDFTEIPGPKGLPVVGTLFDYFKKDGLRFDKLFEAYQKRAIDHGPIYREQIATINTVVISDPVEYSKIIRSEGKYPQRRQMEPIAYYREQKGMDLGLVNDQGEDWYKLRTVTAPKMLKMKEALDFCGAMNEVGNDFVTHLKNVRQPNQEIVGLEKEIFKWAFESMGTFLFEERVGCFSSPMPEKAQAFIEHLQEFFKLLQPLMYNVPTYRIYRTSLWKKFEYQADKVFELGKHFVDKKVAELKAADNVDSDVSGKSGNFLTYLLSQKSINSELVTSTAVDVLQAATETTSNAMLWTLYLLAENPQVQERLYQESTQSLGEGGDITAQNISKLPYVKAVLKESFRKYPITWATSRITDKDLEIAGYNVPAGTHVQANLFGMFRDEKLFPDNDSFKPERWLRESNMDSSLKQLSNLIWGHGARMCIGRRFAEQEMHIMLTKIVQNFQLEYHHEPIEPTLNTVMTPDRPVQLKFIPRNSS